MLRAYLAAERIPPHMGASGRSSGRPKVRGFAAGSRASGVPVTEIMVVQDAAGNKKHDGNLHSEAGVA